MTKSHKKSSPIGEYQDCYKITQEPMPDRWDIKIITKTHKRKRPMGGCQDYYKTLFTRSLFRDIKIITHKESIPIGTGGIKINTKTHAKSSPVGEISLFYKTLLPEEIKHEGGEIKIITKTHKRPWGETSRLLQSLAHKKSSPIRG
jgi:hypothetical protein